MPIVRTKGVCSLSSKVFMLDSFGAKPLKAKEHKMRMVGPGGLEPGAKHAVMSNESPTLAADTTPVAAAIKCRSIDLRSTSERTGNRS